MGTVMLPFADDRVVEKMGFSKLSAEHTQHLEHCITKIFFLTCLVFTIKGQITVGEGNCN